VSRLLASLLTGCALLGLVPAAHAQQFRPTDGKQFPLNQNAPLGMAGEWAVLAGQVNPCVLQPVRVTLPTSGTVTFFEGSPQRGFALAAPAQASLQVGRVYRLKLSDLPEWPGVELYPSIELVGQLHPPPGQADNFPIDVTLLEEELRWAAEGRMITKVIYLEQPNRVLTQHLNGQPRVLDLAPSQNAVAEADLLGRPVAILRLGGRTPDPYRPDPAFFGPGGPVRPSAPAATKADPQLSDATAVRRRSPRPAD
jgi:hypothetical protein